ncbi:hypothetical protein [Xenorhabdus innexi]|uniref:Uncharacterized protein n=1 Tax=Xenorhabdus innexi TaxID=290109 RepID=A0A1N6MRK8_9GAMM|nr:hypothetical protein [Xenorhabdus innexi]PHM33179.1 hypothetical protein Xinn_02708 [Xenorhabdus innexi]SIP71404.1 conserved hypothetical protein [Xenorhabdus innexi]
MKNNYLIWLFRPAWQLFLLQQAVIIPLILGFYFFVWQGNKNAIHSLRSQITEQRNSITLSQNHFSELPALTELHQQIQQITARLNQNGHMTLPTKAAPTKTTVLKRLQQPLTRSGSELMEWKSHKEGHQVLWHIILSLTYEQLLLFLSEIQQLRPLLLIKHLTITPADNSLIVRMVLADMSHGENINHEVKQQ